MQSLLTFIQDTVREVGIPLPANWLTLEEEEIARRFIAGVNRYFFQTHTGIGTTTALDGEFRYFSEFHRFWETHHARILDARIDRQQARRAADALCSTVMHYGVGLLSVTHETHGLPASAIAQARFLSANQDWGKPLPNPFAKYMEDPVVFRADVVADRPERLLRALGIAAAGQADKRNDFARNASLFLIGRGAVAYELPAHFDNDARLLRAALINEPNMGYGPKKANMFIRDMVEMGVWPELGHFDAIDVASDINTIKVALRTRILNTRMPLLSSFLDIFCHQYGYIDEMSALAWRAVWEEWTEIDPMTAPRSPSQLDFLIYRIGREFCREALVAYECEVGHQFYRFGAHASLCPYCARNKARTRAYPLLKLLPCQVEVSRLPQESGVLLVPENMKIVRVFNGRCPFEGVCDPKSDGFRALAPPKSISIKGATGWTTAYAEREQGGGGLQA